MDARLDDREVLALDFSQMGMAIGKLPVMLREGREIGRKAQLFSLSPSRINTVVFLGMGGSAISGDLIGSLLLRDYPLNALVVRNYRLPAFLAKEALYFAVSYSGNTEETLEACETVLKMGGQVVAVTSGGELGTIARKFGFPLLLVPEGFQPRAALGFLFGAALSYIEKLGLVPDLTSEWEETFSLLEGLVREYSPQVPTSGNPAKKLALTLEDKEIVIFATPGIATAAALRWRTQINENSKLTALLNFYPELDHNEIVALSSRKRNAFLLTLRDREEHPRIGTRVTLTTELLRPYLSGTEEIMSQGNSRMSRLFSLVILGDYLSYYLALLQGVDPTPVEAIKALKERLSEKTIGGEK